MIYAFSSESGCLFLVQADDADAAFDTLRSAGYMPSTARGDFEAMGTVLVVKPIGGTDVYVAEGR